MIDKTLKELWETKDSIAKEHDYDLEKLVSYLQSKSNARRGNVFQNVETNYAEQDAQRESSASRRAG